MENSISSLAPLIDGGIPIPDSAFNASSYLSSSSKPYNARLNAKAAGGGSKSLSLLVFPDSRFWLIHFVYNSHLIYFVYKMPGGSWSPEINNQAQYLQIAFTTPLPIYGVIMQGSPIFDQYVTSFKIVYSVDGHAFHYLIDEQSQPQLFSGPIDSRAPVKSMFKIPIEAKMIRIYPLTWHGSIAIRVELLGCLLRQTNNVVPILPVVHHDDSEDKPICDDSLGVENELLHADQIILSSYKTQITEDIAKKSLKLSSSLGWQPNLDSPNEFVLFDFKQIRNVTGIRVKGGEHGWVKSYKILYSNDLNVWNKLLAADAINEQLFLGNFDAITAKTNYFRFPIQTRAIKIIPVSWSNCIEMKIEPIGCFIPYEYIPPMPIALPLINMTCDICPGINADSHMIEGICKCRSGQYWNGVECVARNMCPCVVNQLTYGVGAQFESDNCGQCTCVLGGIVQCKQRECPSCGNGLRRILSPACLCQCEPCPANEILCQTSGTCIAESKWCDGVQDCPDDELNCSHKSQSTQKTYEIVKEKVTITESCHKPKCPPGTIVKFHQKAKPKASAMFDNGDEPSANNINEIFKASNGAGFEKFDSKLPRPNKKQGDMDNVVEECAEYDCIPVKPAGITEEVKCVQPSCPGGYQIVFDTKPLSTACAKYRCELIPQKDVVCNATGRTFNTFDGVEFKYDVCDHILARDLWSNNWTISRELNIYLLSSCSSVL